MNFDQDLESLRKSFVAIISDCAARNDTTIERLLFSRFGNLCDFFGSKVTMDNIIPLLGTCPNKKKHLVRNDCLKSVVGVGLKVGKQTLAKFMLVFFKDFLYDAEEMVVVEFIRTLVALLEAGLITKDALLDDFYSNPHENKQSLLAKLLPCLLHPNMWIREQTLRFICVLCKFGKSS